MNTKINTDKNIKKLRMLRSFFGLSGNIESHKKYQSNNKSFPYNTNQSCIYSHLFFLHKINPKIKIPTVVIPLNTNMYILPVSSGGIKIAAQNTPNVTWAKIKQTCIKYVILSILLKAKIFVNFGGAGANGFLFVEIVP